MWSIEFLNDAEQFNKGNNSLFRKVPFEHPDVPVWASSLGPFTEPWGPSLKEIGFWGASSQKLGINFLIVVKVKILKEQSLVWVFRLAEAQASGLALLYTVLWVFLGVSSGSWTGEIFLLSLSLSLSLSLFREEMLFFQVYPELGPSGSIVPNAVFAIDWKHFGISFSATLENFVLLKILIQMYICIFNPLFKRQSLLGLHLHPRSC